ncbi:unnamed protein product [Staurois parvus]|uniref:Uncharacterized protein n=1 Tax=Staurois parvus TaxID=386267 RepID=A0ABN9BBA6_9NEOB|nr:unnamed protein product [Staurois parvus]
MHPPKGKKNSLAIHTKLSMSRVTPRTVLSGDESGTMEEGEDQRSQDQTAYFHNAEE